MTTKIKNTNLDNTIVTGFTDLGETVASDDVILVFDTSTNTLKKVSTLNLQLGSPTIVSISPTNVDSKDSATTTTFTVTGTGFFTGTTAKLKNNSGSDISFNSVSIVSSTELSCVLNNALITTVGVTDEPYDISVTNSLGTTTLDNQIYVDQRPVFVTASGSLGTQRVGSFSATVEATDPESAGAIRYDVVGGALPTGITLNTSTGVISGSITPEASETIYNFTIQASDVDSNVSFRNFSITLSGPSYSSFTSSGTFAVPSGITVVDVLVVAGGGGGGGTSGGGGGAGGLIFRPGFPVTPGGTVTVTIGCGAGGGTSAPGSTGQDSVFGTLTAKGGGGGAGPGQLGLNGGSGGGGGNGSGNPPTGAGGQGTQPTQPADSGTYGFGNAGGRGDLRNAIFGGTTVSSGGGGGAGSYGDSGSNGSCPGPTSGSGPGGIGRAYTISDGTTSIFYAGGGGGGKPNSPGVGYPNPDPTKRGEGAQGGGGDGGVGGFRNAVAGTANRGGGGGGTHCSVGAAGGKGIVIVKY
jgi:hypothetical protein